MAPKRTLAYRLNRDDICLYTMTSDSVIRIFMPVIDAPTHLQLHASLDRRSFTLGDPQSSSDDWDETYHWHKAKPSVPPIFWLDKAPFLSRGLHYDEPPGNPELGESRRRKLKKFVDDDWELFAYIAKNGSLIVRALTVGYCVRELVMHVDTRLESRQATTHSSAPIYIFSPPSTNTTPMSSPFTDTPSN